MLPDCKLRRSHTLFKICDKNLVNIYSYLRTSHLFFRAVCREVPLNGRLMWPYLKTCLKVSSKHAKSKSIYTYFEWPAVIKWDEVWFKNSYGKNTTALLCDSLSSKWCHSQFYIQERIEVELRPSLNPAYCLTFSHLANFIVCVLVGLDNLNALVLLHTSRYLLWIILSSFQKLKMNFGRRIKSRNHIIPVK